MPDWKDEIRSRLNRAGLLLAREADIVEELSQHLDDRCQELRRSGLSEEEAARAALAELSEEELRKQFSRPEYVAIPAAPVLGENGGSALGALWRDLRYAARLFRLNPAFTVVAVISLALGIGANTAIFQMLDAVRMRLLPVRDPQQLAVIRIPEPHGRTGNFTGLHADLTYSQWEQIRQSQQGFSGLLAWHNSTFNLNTGGEVRGAAGLMVSGSFFNVLGVPAVLGRMLGPADDRVGCGVPVAVLGYGFWQREYGGKASALGATLLLNGHPFQVIGVSPASFFGLEVGRNFDVAIPLCAEDILNRETSRLRDRFWWWLAVVGRLKPGWSLPKANAQLQAISPTIFRETVPPAYDAGEVKHYLGFRLGALPAATGLSQLRSEYETPLWLLLGIAGLVLLIACANLANLMLARASAREREIAVRLALGAARGRLFRQLLTESMLLSLLGALLALVLAQGISRFLVNYLSTEGVRLFLDLSLDWRMLAFTAGLAVLTCILFGVTPGLRAVRTPPAAAMNIGGRGLTSTRERFGVRRILVVSQVALSLVLLVGALLFVRSLHKLMTLDAGFQRTGILVADADFTRLNIPSPQRQEYKRQLLERVRALPGVDGAATAMIVPVSGSGWNNNIFINGESKSTSRLNRVSDHFFTTTGTPLLAGRDFDGRDTLHSPPVAIVNQAFAHKFFSGANPLGKTFREGDNVDKLHPLIEIVGLVKNAKYEDLRKDFGAIAYFPSSQDDQPDPEATMLVRSTLSLGSLMDGLKTAIAQANAAIDLQFTVLADQIQDSLLRERLLAMLSEFFGVLAALLATIGIYGVISYMVARRTSEIGIRMALGANRRNILGMVMREAGTLLALGIAIGALLSLFAARAAAALLYGLKPDDPFTLIASAIILAAAAAAASFLPAQRAARLDPMVALREE
jgi:putative ABC transport system permease protein